MLWSATGSSSITLKLPGSTDGHITKRLIFLLLIMRNLLFWIAFPLLVPQRRLGNFAADYEINAYCASTDRLLGLYSQLHGNIQDVFNENGVQIMSPAYVSDPDEPKVVPPEKFFLRSASKSAPNPHQASPGSVKGDESMDE